MLPVGIDRIFRVIVQMLVVVLIVLLIGAFPAWPHSRSWGYYPVGLSLILIIILLLFLLGRI
jgi:Na+/melibiose symporter-like transporter